MSAQLFRFCLPKSANRHELLSVGQVDMRDPSLEPPLQEATNDRNG